MCTRSVLELRVSNRIDVLEEKHPASRPMRGTLGMQASRGRRRERLSRLRATLSLSLSLSLGLPSPFLFLYLSFSLSIYLSIFPVLYLSFSVNRSPSQIESRVE